MSAKEKAEKALEGADPIAFDVARLAAVIGLSQRQLYKHIERGDLTPKYSGRKRIIPVEEAHRFLNWLPDEEWEL